VAVTERVLETPSTVTLRFPYPAAAEPGQFVMVWLPGDDELPMSLSYTDGPSKGITIKAMGGTSRRAQTIQQGDKIGVRGPYGNHFDVSPKRLLLVSGGSGAAALAPAAERAIAAGAQVTVALGATHASELLFKERFRTMGAQLEVTTDDGSEGTKGFVTAAADRRLASESFDAVWTCGPEVMMKKVIVSASGRHVPTFCSMERHMKCALGMCDACAFGPFHVCVDGPVFPGERVESVREFAAFHRDSSGRRVPL
jgi:dihydroorotate dehydrogenase electron transfer subunit